VRTRTRIAVVAAACATLAASAAADIRLPVVSNFGRSIDPKGRLVELNRFAAGSAVTPDGRFIWTVGGAGGPTRITDLADGSTVQEIASDQSGGGIAFSPDGKRAYVSSAGDHVRVFAVDTATGKASKLTDIGVPPDRNAVPPIMPPDNLPPQTPDKLQSYPEGLALSPDGKTLVAALNLSDRVAIIDTATKAVRQVAIRQDTAPGNRAMPFGVAVAGRTAFVTNEGDGSLATVGLDDGEVNRFYPERSDDRLNAKKTHPQAVVASHDGRRVYVALTAADRVLELDAGDPAHVLREFDVGRAEGLGTQPVSLALSGDDRFLFVANSGEDVVRALDLASGRELARIPSGIYPNFVAVDEPRAELQIVSLKGLGPGPTAGTNESPPSRIIGVLQTLPLPSAAKGRRRAIVRYGRGGDAVPIPVDRTLRAPAGSPLVGADGRGPSPRIKYVFYVVTENKTYDNVLGDLDRGDGDPCLALYGEFRKQPVQRDGSPCPNTPAFDDWRVRSEHEGRGSRMNDGTPITPNEHRIARQFTTLDRMHANSETSDDGHLWTAGGYVNDYSQRNTRAPGRPFDVTIPVSAPPKGFMFHALARQGISFFNYGEAVGVGTVPDSRDTPEELAEEGQVLANSEFLALYPSSGAIDKDPITQRVTYDREPDFQVNPLQGVSRMAYFRRRFNAQLAACADPATPGACAVPQYNHLLLPNNHTSGTTPGNRSPDALVRDTDQAIGQLVSDISHSKIWPYSAIFVVQDDAQDGADHVDGHRITALVASPWAKRGAVVSTRYDDLSVKRTIEIMLGMQPAYLYDALAAPMWDVFTAKPDFKPYQAYDIPEPLMEERNTAHSPAAAASRTQMWNVADGVDEGLIARIQWADRTGSARGCPRRVGPRGRQWNPCALSDADEREAGHERADALLAQLGEFHALQLEHPGLTGVGLAERLHEIARRHPLPAGGD
jgi:DNA-binding beta-propeller fold protein YncE